MAAIVFSPRYHIDIGSHVFPTIKYPLVRQALIDRRVAAPRDFVEPEPASWETLALVHTDDYLEKLRDGTMSADEQAQLEVNASADVVEGFRLMTGGTLLAARIALGKHGLDRAQAREAAPRRAGRRQPADAEPRRAPRRRLPPRLRGPRRGLLPLPRRRGGHPRAEAERAHRARGRHRLRRAPRQRDRVHLRGRTIGVHVLDAPGEQLPVVQAAQHARHPPPRLRRRRAVPAPAGGRAAAHLRVGPGHRVLPGGGRPVRGGPAGRARADARRGCAGATGSSSTPRWS